MLASVPGSMLRTLFVSAILVPGLVGALRSRFVALLLYIWFALFRPQEWVWIDISGLRLSLLLGILVVIPRSWFGRRPAAEQDGLAEESWPYVRHPLNAAMVLFMGVVLLSYANAMWPEVSWPWVDYFGRVVVISLLATSLISTPERLIWVLAVMAASIGFHASKAGLMASLSGGARFYDGLGGTFSDNNGYALAIVMTLFPAIAVVQNVRVPWVRWAMAAMIPGALVTLVCTYSRGGFLALAAAGLVFVLLQRYCSIWLLALAPVALAAALLVPEEYVQRLQTIKTYEEVGEASALSRLHFWRVALRMVEDRPLGIGLKNYEMAYDRYDFTFGRYGRGRSVHSTYFQVLAELGYLGMLVFVALFGLAFWVAFRVRLLAMRGDLGAEARFFYATTANAVIASMVGFLVGGTFLSQALNDLTWTLFGIVAALDRLAAHAVTVQAASGAARRPGRVPHTFVGGRSLRPVPVSQ